jgi:hypothetical protein
MCTKKLRAKLSYEKGARKMLVKLTPGRRNLQRKLSLKNEYVRRKVGVTKIWF